MVSFGDGAQYLFIQQRNGQTRSQSYFFFVQTPFRLYSEINYEFLRGDLTIDLMRSETSTVNIHNGVEHFNRHVLALGTVDFC